MRQFAVVVRELRTWFASLPFVKFLMPYHLILLFGGVGLLFLEELLYKIISYSSYDTLFYDIPLHLLAYYSFFVGAWLTLISKDVKFLPYGMWAYAFVALFPFQNLYLGHIVTAVIYAVGGYFLFRYSATAYSDSDVKTINA